MIVQYAPITIIPIGLAWVLTTRNRVIPPTAELIRKLHPGERSAISRFVSRNPIKAMIKRLIGGLISSDPEFYRAFGGHEGFIRKWQDAVCYVQLCQRLLRNGMPLLKFGIVIEKAFLMLFAILLSIPEAGIRLLFRRLPHLCARWVAQIYYDLSIEAENLNLEYGTESWI